MSLNTMIMSQYDFTSRFKVLPIIEALQGHYMKVKYEGVRGGPAS